MQAAITQMVEVITRVLGEVRATVLHNWPFLVVSILIVAPPAESA